MNEKEILEEMDAYYRNAAIEEEDDDWENDQDSTHALIKDPHWQQAIRNGKGLDFRQLRHIDTQIRANF